MENHRDRYLTNYKSNDPNSKRRDEFKARRCRTVQRENEIVMNFYSFCGFSLKLRRLTRLQFRTYIRLMISLVRDSWQPTTNPSPLSCSVKFEVTRRDSTRSPRLVFPRFVKIVQRVTELLSRATARIYVSGYELSTRPWQSFFATSSSSSLELRTLPYTFTLVDNQRRFTSRRNFRISSSARDIGLRPSRGAN